MTTLGLSIGTTIGRVTNPPLMILYAIVWYAYTRNKKMLPFIGYIILIVLFAIILKKCMYTCCRNWRIMQRPKNTHIGMPSAHAMTSTFVAMYLSAMYPKYTWYFNAAAVVIIFSRVYTCEHSLLQVTVGALIGYAMGHCM